MQRVFFYTFAYTCQLPSISFHVCLTMLGNQKHWRIFVPSNRICAQRGCKADDFSKFVEFTTKL